MIIQELQISENKISGEGRSQFAMDNGQHGDQVETNFITDLDMVVVFGQVVLAEEKLEHAPDIGDQLFIVEEFCLKLVRHCGHNCTKLVHIVRQHIGQSIDNTHS